MALDRAFDADTLSELRKAVLAEAAAAGLPGERAGDVMLAVHELAANAVRHGAGKGWLSMSVAAGQLHCQVSDAGPGGSGNGGRSLSGQTAAQPWPVQPGHGLWLVQASADQVSMASGPAGCRVTVVFTIVPT
ncbi:MAG TPA: ATP-binding protein [Trebonia sp.]|jgi:anti-sigma regulatory factor (Ser/Thr protein kinase)|nr:ATP-binding protein [Trebonia sp.]